MQEMNKKSLARGNKSAFVKGGALVGLVEKMAAAGADFSQGLVSQGLEQKK